MTTTKLELVRARMVLDSRGNPTLACDARAESHAATAMVPSGASTGKHEAVELRDGGKSWGGKGVSRAIANVNEVIAPAVMGFDVLDQRGLDAKLVALDGTANKAKLGANAILGVSMAVARVAAQARGVPLYDSLAGNAGPRVLPTPLLNVINGGAHAGNALSVQEFKIVPDGATFAEALQRAVECYHELKKVLKAEHGAGATNVGDEGGYAPPVATTRDALRLIQRAIDHAGHSGKVRLAMDCAASNFWDEKAQRYQYDGAEITTEELAVAYEALVDEFGLVSIEDPFHEEDYAAFASFTARMRAKRVQVIGDDIFVTNPVRLKRGIDEEAASALLMKFNQIGTVTEAMDASHQAMKAGWCVVVSHRSGETDDSFIADAAVALSCGQIKTGAPARGERTAKYNRLLQIEEQLGERGSFQGLRAFASS